MIIQFIYGASTQMERIGEGVLTFAVPVSAETDCSWLPIHRHSNGLIGNALWAPYQSTISTSHLQSQDVIAFDGLTITSADY